MIKDENICRGMGKQIKSYYKHRHLGRNVSTEV